MATDRVDIGQRDPEISLEPRRSFGQASDRTRKVSGLDGAGESILVQQ
jgi:hypothetical protein